MGDPCRTAAIFHQDLLRLNSNLFMKIGKVLNSITLNAILPWSFPVRQLPALFCYLLNTYDHSFLKVFIISQLILTFQPFCFLFMPFPDAPNITQNLSLSSAFGTSFGFTLPPLNSAYIFRSKSKMLFGLNCSILRTYLLLLALFHASFNLHNSICVFSSIPVLP